MMKKQLKTFFLRSAALLGVLGSEITELDAAAAFATLTPEGRIAGRETYAAVDITNNKGAPFTTLANVALADTAAYNIDTLLGSPTGVFSEDFSKNLSLVISLVNGGSAYNVVLKDGTIWKPDLVKLTIPAAPAAGTTVIDLSKMSFKSFYLGQTAPGQAAITAIYDIILPKACSYIGMPSYTSSAHTTPIVNFKFAQ